MKKILSLILAGLMTLSAASFVAADDAAVDAAVEQTNSAEDYAIEFLANYGIFKGTSAAELVADAASPIQRYQMALFVSRISTGWVDDAQWEDGPANNSTFEDIGEEPANKYLGALSYANQNGIIEGYSPRTFAPYDGITYRDALTMVVRTLGYKGLAYPWGYIEKAVELGLTKDVNAAYTDNLTRGQVAVIIYNAMFANTKSGETLAKKIFNCDFGWENIVIIASDKASFAANGLRAKKGYVAFKLLKDNGDLSKETYYVKKSELGLNGDHDDELQVGAIYVALFTVKDDIVSMVDADSLNFKTVMNMGITDNAGEAVAVMPIKATLADYSVVKELQKSDIISSTDKFELIVYAAGTTEVVGTDGTRVAIDWNTQNILKWVDEVKDAKGNVTEAAHWETAWVYNKTLDRYYQYVLDNKDGKVYINWMSDEEFAKFYADAVKVVKNQLDEFVNLGADGVNADAAYAKLRLFDTDGDGVAEKGLYKKYAIGQISVSAAECGRNVNDVNHANGTYKTYKITTLDGETVYEQFVEGDHDARHEYLDNGTKLDGKKTNSFAWLNVADSVTTFYKEDGSFENGSVVVYNVNKTSGEIEIIKHVTTKGTASDDADSYIASGVLKGYSTGKATINVDGQNLGLGYATLDGSIYGNVAKDIKTRTEAAQSLDTFLMQYVTYVVVDGRVVDIDLKGQTSDIIVVLGYAGVTSDGYIAVYGYGSDDSSAHIYRIASYNGWKQGDYRYYPSNAWTDEAFVAGTIYNITSYDDATKSYNVYTENSDMSARDNAAYHTFDFDRGYRVIDKGLKNAKGESIEKIEKMSKDDKYFIVVVDDKGNATGVVYVRTGVIANGWSVKGDAVVKADSGAYVIYAKASDINGFKNTAHEIGFVIYEKKIGAALEAAYDEAIGGDWYLLGSTQTEVRTFDLLTGNTETCFVSNNIDLKKGHVYVTMNFGDARMIINELPDNAGCDMIDHMMGKCKLFDRIANLYSEQNASLARFMVTSNSFTFTKGGISKLALANAFGLVSGSDTIAEKIAADKIGDIAYYVLSADGGHYIDSIKAIDFNDYTIYTGRAILDCETNKVVVYVLASDVNAKTAEVGQYGDKAITIKSWLYKDAIIEGSLKLDWKGTYSASAKKTTLGDISLYFTTIDEDHADIAANGYLFGIDNDHGRSLFSYNDTRILVDGKETYVLANGQMSIGTLDCYQCNLVNAISASLKDITLGANEKKVVTIEIKGNNPVFDENNQGYSTGNNITVEVTFEADADGYVSSAAITSVKINNVDNGNLNSVDIQTLVKLGIND